MTVRRLMSVLSVAVTAGLAAALVASAPVAAQPKAPAKKPTKAAKDKAPVAPAKDSTGTAGSATPPGAGTGSSAGSAVQMAEDPPPTDLNGTAENPTAPKTVGDPDAPTVITSTAPVPSGKLLQTGVPIEAALRTITLPQNASEVALSPHAVVLPYASTMALRARYGITSKVQLGLTYVVGGLFRDPQVLGAGQAFHSGKAIGLDVTVMLKDWVGVSFGIPVYISPLAVSTSIGVPMKFTFGDKYALGGFDDLINLRIQKFAPSFYQEAQNATNAANAMTNTVQSQGEFRVSLYGIYQYQPDLAIIARTGIQAEDFASGKTDACFGECLTTFLHAGIQYSPRSFVDLGLSIGFDDLAHGGSFAPAGFLAIRI